MNSLRPEFGTWISAIQALLVKRPTWASWTIKCFLLLLICSFLGLATLGALPSRFILIGPSVSYTKPLAAIAGIGLGALLMAYFMRFPSPDATDWGNAKRLLFLPIIVGYVAYRALAFGAPSLVALIVRDEFSTLVQVDDHDAYGGKYCRHAVRLTGFAENMICDVQSDLRAKLLKGQPVRIGGFGSSLGIYVERFEPLFDCNSQQAEFLRHRCEDRLMGIHE